MKGEIRIAYAEREGRLVHVSQFESGVSCNCVCPVCKTPTVARKGERKQHHFAHYPGANCCAETVLHEVAKRILYDRVTDAISKSLDIPVEWKCLHCRAVHQGNILAKSSGVVVEQSFGTCRPDVALIDKHGNPTHFLEVVVTHEPEEQVTSYCKNNGIILAKFKIKNAIALERLGQDDVWHPDFFDFCLRPHCAKCKLPLSSKTMYVVIGNCWNCGSDMNIAMMDVEEVMSGPSSFSETDIVKAKEYGAILQSNYSQTVQKSYISNTCGGCGAFTGEFYLHDHYHLIEPDKGISRGYYCVACGLHYEEEQVGAMCSLK